MSAAIDALLHATPRDRAHIFASLTTRERVRMLRDLDDALSNPWRRYQDDPVGFVTTALGETLWSRQRAILESIRDNKRTAVPACHAPGKSHIAARAVAWWVTVHPPGTVRVVTTASTYRQVRGVLWPHIRRVQQRHGLPGEVLTTEWKIGQEIVADGFSPADHDETAVQGVHAPHLLVVVDEAGGIGATLGRALEALMTGGHTRLLVLGNPPVDDEGSWFERACSSDLYNVIPIDAYATPNFTGEDAGECHACPPNVPSHPVAEHLVDQAWVQDVINEFGEDSAFVEARVHARFPRTTANKVMPLSWLEDASDNPSPLDGNVVRLGVDVASDGGDEFVVAWADGWVGTIRHRSSGSQNANAVDVAGVVLQQIREAERVHRDRGITEPVRVKIDSIGVGWGVTSVLERWRDEQMHSSVIVPVNVADRPGDATKFANQRAEMWWNGRVLVQPASTEPRQSVRLEVDQRTLAQLSGPQYKSDSSGRIQIERKADMKRRGVPSPDRAEALLLAFYEPPGPAPIPTVKPISFGQSNPWSV